MNQFRILNSRKRAIVALVHSIAFGLLAAYQLLASYHPTALIRATSGQLAGPVALTTIYFIVTIVLWILVLASRAPLEKLYFAFCSTSAAIGLFRVILGDPTQYTGNSLRVVMLGCAVVIGFMILRLHTARQSQFAD
jgi:hypothetical protein